MIGAASTFFLLATGLVAGPYFDRGYLRHLMVVGVVLAILGIMTTSISRSYYQFFLSQGVCFGIGAGLVYVPALAFVNVAFVKNRALVIGMVTGGASIGQ